MEEQLVKVLKVFAEAMVDYCSNIANSESIIDAFLQKAELALSPYSRQELINCLNKLY